MAAVSELQSALSLGLIKFKKKYNKNTFINLNKKQNEDTLEQSGELMQRNKGQYFSEEEKEFVILLINLGMNKNAAILLVFLAGTSLTTFREIESGTDLCESEISSDEVPNDQGWIRTCPSEKKGRLKKVYGLTKPVADIVQDTENMKKVEMRFRSR